jgi:hypothetical protein
MIEVYRDCPWLPKDGDAFATYRHRMRVIDFKLFFADELNQKRFEWPSVQ